MKQLYVALLLPAALLAQGGFSGTGRYEIVSSLSGKVLDLDRNDQRTVIQYEARNTDNQTWDAVDAGGGYFYLRNGMNGNALTQTRANNSVPVMGAPFEQSEAQKWRFEGASDGAVMIMNSSGKVLDIPYGSKNNGVKINTYDRNGEINQRWTLRRVSGPGNDRRDRDIRSNNNRYDNNRRDDRNNNGRYDNDRRGPQSRYSSNNDNKYYDQNSRSWMMRGDGACFYSEANFQGDAFCIAAGEDRRRTDNTWDGNFRSVRLFGRARTVDLYEQEDMRGRRSTLNRENSNLDSMNRRDRVSRVGSIRVD